MQPIKEQTKKAIRKPTSIANKSRKLAREVARNEMKRQELSRIGRKDNDGKSWFSKNWRDYVLGWDLRSEGD